MIGTPVDGYGANCRSLPLKRHSFLMGREEDQAAASGSPQTVSRGERIHDGLRQQIAPGRRRVNITGERRGR